MFNSRKYYTITWLSVLMLLLIRTGTATAITARDKYHEAEACYQKLRDDSKRQQYRDQWLACIDKFDAVYRHDPSGPWAAAGLYRSGMMYQELYQRSFMLSDQKEALDIFERIIKRFPQSQYRRKSAEAIRALTETKKSKISTAESDSPNTATAKQKYIAAEKCYQKLRNSPKRQKYRDQWLACIDKFDAVYRSDPSDPRAAEGLYMSAALYQELYQRSFKTSDKKKAREIFERIVQDYPNSDYRGKAAEALGFAAASSDSQAESESAETENIAEEVKAVDTIAAEINKAASAPQPVVREDRSIAGQKITVKGLRYWSNPSYTRVVIDAEDETAYTHRLLKQDPSINKPQRLYVDLSNSRLDSDIEKVVPINDNLLADARAGQYTLDSVRVVVDIKSFKTYKIFSLKNPFRIVIDVWGSETEEPRTAPQGEPGESAKLPPSALAKQLALGVRRIVIDPGHGGRDFGAPGYVKGVHEKHVVLKIAQRLAEKIRENLNCEVFLTRNTDEHLTLEERTAIANTKNADLFISIHTNAARDRRAYGIETFFLNLATDDDAILVAARENATSTKNISDLQAILSDLMQNAKINESSRLAVQVQGAMHKNLQDNFSRIKNKGVKQAPFYVLLGAQMPAILIETAFISNPRECSRLISPQYQDKMCEAIVDGIREYIREISPSTVFKSNSGKDLKG